MKAKFSKTAIVCLVLVLCLTLMGSGFARWSEDSIISGMFATGVNACVAPDPDCGGTIGFWKNWDKHNTYTETDINDWLANINDASDWLVPDIDMEKILKQAKGKDAKQKFLGHYLATRLNVESDRLYPGFSHDFNDPDDYLGLNGSGTLGEIISAIEKKCGTSPTEKQFELMKDICDGLNNLEI
jgi:hypothetical protein